MTTNIECSLLCTQRREVFHKPIKIHKILIAVQLNMPPTRLHKGRHPVPLPDFILHGCEVGNKKIIFIDSDLPLCI